MSYEVILGFGLDLIFGDPIKLPHPVKGIGKVIKLLEKIVDNKDYSLRVKLTKKMILTLKDVRN